MKNFTYLKEAEFPGGSAEWMFFLQQHLKPKVPVKKGAPKGTYITIIRFIVTKEGNISDIKAETKNGYGMEEEAIRVIKKSPKWIPCIFLDKIVNAYRRQPITFVIEEW